MYAMICHNRNYTVSMLLYYSLFSLHKHICKNYISCSEFDLYACLNWTHLFAIRSAGHNVIDWVSQTMYVCCFSFDFWAHYSSILKVMWHFKSVTADTIHKVHIYWNHCLFLVLYAKVVAVIRFNPFHFFNRLQKS